MDKSYQTLDASEIDQLQTEPEKPILLTKRGGTAGNTSDARIPAGNLVVVVAGGAVETVVSGLAHEVDPEGDDGDA